MRDLRFPFLVSIAVAITGCAGTPPLKQSPLFATKEDLTSGNFASVKLCRPDSIARSAEAPEIRLNKEVIGQIGSGAMLEFSVKPDIELDLFLSASPLLYRFSDDLIFQKKLGKGERIALKVTPQRNLIQGVTVLLGGAIAESSRQVSTGQSGNWLVTEEHGERFAGECKD